jgi:excisionase family DNA binding protein
VTDRPTRAGGLLPGIDAGRPSREQVRDRQAVGAKHLTTSQAAALFHVSPKTVARWAKQGKLPHVRTMGGHRRYPAAEIRELAQGLTFQPEPSYRTAAEEA